MDVKGANPFLFADDDHASPSSSASNPFLMDTDEYNSAYKENDTSHNVFKNNATNPFAFDPMDLTEPESSNNIFGNSSFVPENTIFSSNDQYLPENQIMAQATITINQDFFSSISDENQPFGIGTSAPCKPTELHLKNINNIDLSEEMSRQPPSKETQDLLISVMGAMDATSSHLLDKIPPTRTPSPVSMRDLHSPSPTPEPYGDLLGVEESVPTREEQNFFTPCDINQNPPTTKTAPPKPPPPRPAPPRPAPPISVQAPQKPPPPKVEQQPSSTQNNADNDDEICLFGVDGTLPKKPPTTKEDILNLYNTAKNEKKIDLLCGSDEAINLEPVDNTPGILGLSFQPNTNAQFIETSSIQTTQETLISPEVSQNDLQMDTSDSHSKESFSSVTFNPFGGTEEMQDENTNKVNIASDIMADTPFDIMNGASTQNFKNDYEAVVEHSSNTIETSVSQTEIISNDNITGNNIFEVNSSTLTTNNTLANTVNSLDTNESFGLSEEASSEPSFKDDEFDAFAQKFDSVYPDHQNKDAFSSDAWGAGNSTMVSGISGFEADEPFDSFLTLQEPPMVPQSTPYLSKQPSADSDEDKDFSVYIKPKNENTFSTDAMPVIAPPPIVQQTAFTDTSPRFNPFDQSEVDFTDVTAKVKPDLPLDTSYAHTEAQESPLSPLFDEDVSQPLQPFPRIDFQGTGWEMQLRQPNKKKITGQRFWKKIFMRIVYQQDCVLLQLFNQKEDKDPFQELPLQPCYSVSDIGAQQYDQFGKIFTLKLQYIFYKERPGVRPGQVKKAEKLSNRLSKFAAYAIQGDYEGVKEFGSDLKKLGLPVEHAPQVSQLMKLGSLNYEDLKQFSFSIEEALFRLQAHRDRALQYKMEEVQITLVDELYVEQDSEGHIERQIARVRLFFLGFLTGMPDIELGVNDMRRQGKEVVGRHDIIPVVTEEWIRLEATEFHSCVQQDEYERTHVIKFKPPDACYIELMRFRVRPPRNRELPLQLKATICITGTKIELRADVLVPGFASRKLGQIPCEDVQIRFPIPECWIYLFRVEKHFRYGSVKSAHRRTGKIKGIERILGTMETLQESLIEVTSGQAKYEHQHRAIVWRCPRLPKEGQGAYTTHNMVCKMALTSYDQMPDKLAEYCYVEFTMPATQVSHCVCRSVSLQNSDSDEPPEKYVRYLARHEYRVGIEHIEGENPNAYAVATKTVAPPKEQKPPTVPEVDSSSDSD